MKLTPFDPKPMPTGAKKMGKPGDAISRAMKAKAGPKKPSVSRAGGRSGRASY